MRGIELEAAWARVMQSDAGRVFLNGINEGLAAITREGQIIFCNERFMEITGAVQSPAGQSIIDLVRGSCRDVLREQIAQTHTQGTRRQMRFQVNTQELLVQVSMSCLDAEDQEFFGVVVTDLSVLDQTLSSLQEEVQERLAAENLVTERTMIAEERTRQLRRLHTELINIEQRERRRLADLLHDHIQQLLAAAKMKVSMLRASIEDKEVRDRIRQIKDLLEQSIKASRSLSVELSPPCLYESGLVAAMDWLVEWMKEKHGLTVVIESDDRYRDMPDDVRVLAFMVSRELLFNVVKHAGVKQAWVRISRYDDGVVLMVCDQGKGFEYCVCGATGAKAGLGLLAVRERLELAGGCLEVESKKGMGTRVSAILPYEQRQPAIKDESVCEKTGWLF